MNCDTWPVPSGDCANGCTIPDDTDPDIVEAASVLAGTILHTLSGNRVGVCEDTLRPIAECGVCGPTCRCTGSGDRVRLLSPVGPVTAVTAVTIDGTPLADGTYRYYPSSQLLYRMPPDRWPFQDRKWADCGETDTMCVDVEVGYPADAWALAVHAELTCELVKSCTGSKCRIPTNATQVTGQGISITLSPTELKQFIPSVAGWVAAVNPDNMRQPGMVYSPDLDSGGGGCGC